MVQHSWRESTRKVYSTCIHKWTGFCEENSVDELEPRPTDVTDFLSDLIDVGAKYNTVNLARCSLSAVMPHVLDQTIRKEEMIGRVVKAANNLNPSEPRYSKFWDVGLVFQMFREWGITKNYQFTAHAKNHSSTTVAHGTEGSDYLAPQCLRFRDKRKYDVLQAETPAKT